MDEFSRTCQMLDAYLGGHDRILAGLTCATTSHCAALFQLATGSRPALKAAVRPRWIVRLLQRYKRVLDQALARPVDMAQVPGLLAFVLALLRHAPAHWLVIRHDRSSVLQELLLFGADHDGVMLGSYMNVIRRLSLDQQMEIEPALSRYLQ